MMNLRLSLRRLANRPLYTLLAIGTLAVGIGCLATCFAAVNALFIRPIPVATEQDRLLSLSETRDAFAGDFRGFTLEDRELLLTRSRTVDGIWLLSHLTVIMEGDSTPLRYLGSMISANTFDLLGARPLLGRNLTAADERPGARAVALISHRAWQDRFNAAPEVVGSVLRLNGQATEIVGVMPPEWRYPSTSDIWLPLSASTGGVGDEEQMHQGYYFDTHARLAPGATVAEARAEFATLAGEIAAELPDSHAGLGFKVMRWRDSEIGTAGYFTFLLFGAGIVIFLIACANVANLQLARGSTRTPELSVRIALGASRPQLFRQLLLENLVLGVLGAVGGAVFGLWGIDLIVASMGTDRPFWMILDPDWRVFAFLGFTSVVSSLLFGLTAALRDSRPDVIAGLKEGSRTSVDQGPYGLRLRNALVVAEIALALVLLVGAGLMMRSFLALRAIEPGYEANNVLSFRVGFPFAMNRTPAEIGEFFQALPTRLERLPDVTAAGAVSSLPGRSGEQFAMQIYLSADAAAPLGTVEQTTFRVATRGYFPAMQIPLIAGRLFDGEDSPNSEPVCLVDETVATVLGTTPDDLIGRYVGTDPGLKVAGDHRARIVGVVGAIRHQHDDPDSPATFYADHAQRPENFMSVVMRTTEDPLVYANSIGNEVFAVDQDLPVYDVLTLDQVVLHSIWTQHFFSRLFLCAGIIALLLACVGIYGVMTFTVSQRRHEIGLRMALGASARDVVREVLRRGSELVVLGLVAGFVGAFILANLLATSLYGVSPYDPPTFFLVPVILASVALLACYLSSRRATLVDPMASMRLD